MVFKAASGKKENREVLHIDITHSLAEDFDLPGVIGRVRSRDVARGVQEGINNLLTTARSLGLVALTVTANENDPEVDSDPTYEKAILREVAERAYIERRRRNKIFDDESLFGEPAWDILLDLFIAGECGERISVTQASIGAAVPSTTGLRWICLLEQKGLLVRESDRSDARRYFLQLSPAARAKMVQYLSTL